MHRIKLATVVNRGNGMQGVGPPEVATGGEDGAVRVWDTRQRHAPVAAFAPADADKVAPTAQHLHEPSMPETLPLADVHLRIRAGTKLFVVHKGMHACCTPSTDPGVSMGWAGSELLGSGFWGLPQRRRPVSTGGL